MRASGDRGQVSMDSMVSKHKIEGSSFLTFALVFGEGEEREAWR